MDEKQLQEAIDGMIGQRPKLVVERPREVRQGMGLFEASQARPEQLTEAGARVKAAREVVKKLDKASSQLLDMSTALRDAKGSLNVLRGAGTEHFQKSHQKVAQAMNKIAEARALLENASDDADNGVKAFKQS